jgi:nicotinate-nucleotide adenylyltransferase
MKIALFGTSADPPTAAHQAILDWLAAHSDQVAVWAADNPFKAHQTSLAHRTAMLRHLIAAMNLPRHNVQVYEQFSDRRSLISLQRAQAWWGSDHDYSLVIGSDLIHQIPRWYQVEKLLSAVTLVIVPRSGYPITPQALETIRQLGGEYRLASTEAPAISSTGYRDTKDQTVLPETVTAYIQQQNLYLS